jgi:DeoR family transcriptional regulator, fructose operon transcriptional repressor
MQDLFSFASLNGVNRIITDCQPKQELSGDFKEASVEILVSF